MQSKVHKCNPQVTYIFGVKQYQCKCGRCFSFRNDEVRDKYVKEIRGDEFIK